MPKISHFQLPDQALVELSLDGDNRAFQTLLKRYTGLMVSYAYRITGSRSDAEDAVQEAFITAWESLKNLKNPAKVKSWLMRIVSHRAVDIIRRRNDTLEITDNSLTDSDTEPARLTEQNAQIDALKTALMKFPPTQRQCWVLREIGGYSYKEIAEQLDLPVSTVRGNIARARSAMLHGLETWK